MSVRKRETTTGHAAPQDTGIKHLFAHPAVPLGGVVCGVFNAASANSCVQVPLYNPELCLTGELLRCQKNIITTEQNVHKQMQNSILQNKEDQYCIILLDQ